MHQTAPVYLYDGDGLPAISNFRIQTLSTSILMNYAELFFYEIHLIIYHFTGFLFSQIFTKVEQHVPIAWIDLNFYQLWWGEARLKEHPSSRDRLHTRRHCGQLYVKMEEICQKGAQGFSRFLITTSSLVDLYQNGTMVIISIRVNAAGDCTYTYMVLVPKGVSTLS